MQSNNFDEYYEEKPDLSDYEQQILNCFWGLKRETTQEKAIQRRDIEQASSFVDVEADILTDIILTIDDHYRMMYAEELKRKRPK